MDRRAKGRVGWLTHLQSAIQGHLQHALIPTSRAVSISLVGAARIRDSYSNDTLNLYTHRPDDRDQLIRDAFGDFR